MLDGKTVPPQTRTHARVHESVREGKQVFVVASWCGGRDVQRGDKKQTNVFLICTNITLNWEGEERAYPGQRKQTDSSAGSVVPVEVKYRQTEDG